MKGKTLYYNGRILTMAQRQAVDSMAVSGGCIVAVGNRLEHDPDFARYTRIDLKKRTVTPGLVDAHTHFYLLAKARTEVSLHGVDTLEKCLAKIKKFAATLPPRAWVIGAGLFPDSFPKPVIPNKEQLDRVSGGRPAFIFFKDTHSAWVNSAALEFGKITARTPDPDGGRIERNDTGEPTGILREIPAYLSLYHSLPPVSIRRLEECYRATVEEAYRSGVTGVHSFDGPDGFEFLARLDEKRKLGLRINYYPPAAMIEQLEKTGTVYGCGTEWLRIAGVKIFSDGALGSQTALCFNQYIGSKGNRGIEVTSVKEMTALIRRASRLGLPSAIHAIGDKANANVLEAIEKSRTSRFRHRIEHVQLLRRKDLAGFKRTGAVASVQPSHCPADIEMVRRYWGARSRNAYIFRSMLDKNIPVAFGSDAPIEQLRPLHGIAAAVRRALPGSRDVFHPEQRVTAYEALEAYTTGAAYSCGLEQTHGRLLPGFAADFIVLDCDPARIAPARLYDLKVLATIIDGQVRHVDRSLRW